MIKDPANDLHFKQEEQPKWLQKAKYHDKYEDVLLS